jgi:hypothetical protein
MGILSFNVNVTGLTGDQVNPRRNTMVTTDNLATITTAGYLNNQNVLGNPIFPTDIFEALYNYNPATQLGTFGIFQLTYSQASGYTLVIWDNPGNVLLPVVSNDFANFNGTGGQIKDSGYSPSNAAKTKVVMASAAVTNNGLAVFLDTAGTIGNPSTTTTTGFGITAATGSFIATLGNFVGGSAAGGNNAQVQLFPTTAAKGSLIFLAAANTGNTNTTVTNVAMGQASVISIPDPATATADFVLAPAALVNGNLVKASGTAGLVQDAGFAAANVQTSSLTSPDAISDLVWIDVPLTAAGLATSGHIAIQASSGSKQYKVRDIRVNYSASGFSGGGDRLVTVTDGTTVFNNAGITAALLGTPINTIWGGTGNPLAGAVAMNTSSVAGAAIYAVYSGGTTDWGTGTVNISVLVQRVA